MKRKQWQRRLLSCFLAVVVLLVCVLSCLPVRAGAIVPLGLVQSALASYVTSTGYKMYNDQGTGEDILDSLSDLYQTWLDSPAGVVASQWTLAHIASIEAVYTDSSGHIVIKKAAADVFQQFADWIQSEYNVSVGSDVPVEVVQPVPGGTSAVSDYYGTAQASDYFYYSFYTQPLHVRSGTTFSYTYKRYNSTSTITVNLRSDNSFYACVLVGSDYFRGPFFVSTQPFVVDNEQGTFSVRSTQYTTKNGTPFYGALWVSNLQPATLETYFTDATNFVSDSLNSFTTGQVLSDIYNFTFGGVVSTSPGVLGLAVSLAQNVVDRASQLDQDDSLVVAVGAGVGATAEDIAGIVAQGVKAQTLDPAVTVVADAVIDTPVQPYPDIDGLGLPTLGAALVSRFPFCVPWDFVDTLRILNATPIPPVFDVTLVPASVAARWGVSGNYALHVDLTSPEYAKLFVALRWGTLVGFCLGLALLTKRLIWTA